MALALCLGSDVGALRARGRGFSGTNDVAWFPWSSAVASLRPSWPISSVWGVGAAIDGFLALTRPRVEYGLNSTAHRAPVGGGCRQGAHPLHRARCRDAWRGGGSRIQQLCREYFERYPDGVLAPRRRRRLERRNGSKTDPLGSPARTRFGCSTHGMSPFLYTRGPGSTLTRLRWW